MSESVIKEALVQAPSLVVLVVVVWMFLRFMERMNQSVQHFFRELQQEHLDERQRCRTVIEENNHLMREFVESRTK